jgi:hypothetical protein
VSFFLTLEIVPEVIPKRSSFKAYLLSSGAYTAMF